MSNYPRVSIPQEVDLIENPGLPGKKISGPSSHIINFALDLINNGITYIESDVRWSHILAGNINDFIQTMEAFISRLKRIQEKYK